MRTGHSQSVQRGRGDMLGTAPSPAPPVAVTVPRPGGRPPECHAEKSLFAPRRQERMEGEARSPLPVPLPCQSVLPRGLSAAGLASLAKLLEAVASALRRGGGGFPQCNEWHLTRSLSTQPQCQRACPRPDPEKMLENPRNMRERERGARLTEADT